MFTSSRWRGSNFPSRPSLLPRLLLVVSALVLSFPLQVQAANEIDAENAEETSARVKAAALTQGTDGGSGAMGFVWAAFCILIALPLLTAGLKLMRLTCGAGLGLVLCFVVWLSFVNSSPTNGFASTPFLSDVLITIPTLVLSALALGLGLFRPARYVGHNLLCLAGGIAFVLQLMLFREGLLIPIREVIWGLVGLAAILGLVLGVWRQRIGVLSMSSMAGSFLLSLGVDLIINKQQGMSFGLRVIFDDNSAHETLLVRKNYKPTLSTQIILGVGLAFAAIGSVSQHFLYPGDFIKRPLSKQWSSLLAPPSEQPFDRSTKFYAEDLEPGAISPPEEAYVRPWERNKNSGGVGIASSETYFDQPPQMDQRQTLEQQRRYEEEQRVIYEQQQRFAAERQAYGGGGGIRHVATHQPSPAVSNRTLTPEFFDPSSTLMRPPIAFRPVNNQSAPNSPLHSQSQSQGAPPPSASRPRPAQQQEVPWQQQQQQQQQRLAQQQEAGGGGRLNIPLAPDRSTNSSPSSIYSTRGDTLPPASKTDLLNAVQKLYGTASQQQMGKDRPLVDASRGEGGSGKRYEPPSARYL